MGDIENPYRVTKGPEEQLEQISKRRICLMDCQDLIYLMEESFLYLFIPGGGLLTHKVSYATTSSVEFTRPLSLLSGKTTVHRSDGIHGVTQQLNIGSINL